MTGSLMTCRCVPLPLIVYDPRLDEVLFLNRAARGSGAITSASRPANTRRSTSWRASSGGCWHACWADRVDPAEFARLERGGRGGRTGRGAPGSVPVGSAARRIGEFELLSELGHGNMGTVYRAWQPSLGRQVALKVVAGANDAKAKARFRREVRAGAGGPPEPGQDLHLGVRRGAVLLHDGAGRGGEPGCGERHPSQPQHHGCRAWTWRAGAGRSSSACEESRKAEKSLSSAGRGARDRAAAGGGAAVRTDADLKPGDRGYVHQVVELIRQVAMAAHALHAVGVVHRDIKPGNIMVTADGAQAVLMDLGIAQLADDVEGRITRTRQFMGTVRYASPEQVLSVGKVDARSDMYSLGATLWELLTLRRSTTPPTRRRMPR